MSRPLLVKWNSLLPQTLTINSQQFARSARPKQDGADTKRGSKQRWVQQVSDITMSTDLYYMITTGNTNYAILYLYCLNSQALL